MAAAAAAAAGMDAESLAGDECLEEDEEELETSLEDPEQDSKFWGDLLTDGKIAWQQTGQIFNSPSAWATYCKKLVNPAKKSGCGWASVKYKGQKLDQYKASLISEGEEEDLGDEEEDEVKGMKAALADSMLAKKVDEKSRKLLAKSLSDSHNADHSKRLECQNRIPVRYCSLGSRDSVSHPFSHPLPSLQDIDMQMDYQLKLQGSSNSFQPCLALICGPYYHGNQGVESKISPFWVMPPPEQRPYDYGIPMEVEVTYIQDGFLTNDVLHEMMLLVEFYKGAPDMVKFQDAWSQEQTYLDKLKLRTYPGTGLRCPPTQQLTKQLFEESPGLLQKTQTWVETGFESGTAGRDIHRGGEKERLEVDPFRMFEIIPFWARPLGPLAGKVEAPLDVLASRSARPFYRRASQELQ
ncbi:hypothetical protein Chor_017290 [Crotalus horridus]